LTDIVKQLVEKGADVNALYFPNSGDYSAISYAIKNKYTDIALLLIENKANINTPSFEKTNLLLDATKNHMLDIAKLLIEKGVNTNAQDYNGDTALMMILREYDKFGIEMLNLLFEHGADLNLQNKKNSTALHDAISQNIEKCIQWLLDKKVNVNLQNSNGWTPLMIAVSNKDTKTIKLLLEAGADTNLKTTDFKTTVDYCAGNEELEKLLKSAGAKIKNSFIDTISFSEVCSEIEKAVIKHTYQRNYGNIISAAISSGNFFKELDNMGFKKSNPFRKHIGVEYADWESAKYKIECASVSQNDEDHYSIEHHITGVDLSEIGNRSNSKYFKP